MKEDSRNALIPPLTRTPPAEPHPEVEDMAALTCDVGDVYSDEECSVSQREHSAHHSTKEAVPRKGCAASASGASAAVGGAVPGVVTERIHPFERRPRPMETVPELSYAQRVNKRVRANLYQAARAQKVRLPDASVPTVREPEPAGVERPSTPQRPSCRPSRGSHVVNLMRTFQIAPESTQGRLCGSSRVACMIPSGASTASSCVGLPAGCGTWASGIALHTGEFVAVHVQNHVLEDGGDLMFIKRYDALRAVGMCPPGAESHFPTCGMWLTPCPAPYCTLGELMRRHNGGVLPLPCTARVWVREWLRHCAAALERATEANILCCFTLDHVVLHPREQHCAPPGEGNEAWDVMSSATLPQVTALAGALRQRHAAWVQKRDAAMQALPDAQGTKPPFKCQLWVPPAVACKRIATSMGGQWDIDGASFRKAVAYVVGVMKNVSTPSAKHVLRLCKDESTPLPVILDSPWWTEGSAQHTGVKLEGIVGK